MQIELEILPIPGRESVWAVRTMPRPVFVGLSPEDERPVGEQAWSLFASLARPGDSVRLLTTPGVAAELVDAFPARNPELRRVLAKSGWAVSTLSERTGEYEPSEDPSRAIEDVVGEARALADLEASLPALRKAGPVAFAMEESETTRRAAGALLSYVSGTGGLAILDAARKGGANAEVEGEPDGRVAVALLREFHRAASDRVRSTELRIPTGEPARPWVRVILAPDGKATVDVPELARILGLDRDERSATFDPPRFLTSVGNGPEEELPASTVWRALATRGVPASALVAREMLDRAAEAGAPAHLIPLDSSGVPVGVRLEFSPEGGMRALVGDEADRDPSRGTELEAFVASVRKPAGPIAGVSCCGGETYASLGPLRALLPFAAVGEDDPLLPPRPRRIEVGPGVPSLSPTGSVMASLAEARLRASVGRPDRMEALLDLSGRLVSGTTLVAPTVEEARLLAVAASAAGTAVGDSEAFVEVVHGPRFLAEFGKGVEALRSEGLLPFASDRLKPIEGAPVPVVDPVRGTIVIDGPSLATIGAAGSVVVEVGSDCALLPPRRAAGVRGPKGLVPASEELHLSVLAAHLLEGDAELVRGLSELGAVLERGPVVLSAPTRGEGAVLAAAAGAARRLSLEAPGRLRSDWKDALREAFRAEKAAGRLPAAVSLSGAEFVPAGGTSSPRVSRSDTVSPSLPAARIAHGAAMALAAVPKGREAWIAVAMSPDGKFRLSDGTPLGRSTDSGFLSSPLGRAMASGRVAAIPAAAALEALAPGFVADRTESAAVRAGKAEVRLDALMLGCGGSLAGESLFRAPCAVETVAALSAYVREAGTSSVEAVLAAAGRSVPSPGEAGIASVLDERAAASLKEDLARWTTLAAARSRPSGECVGRDLSLAEAEFARRWGCHPERALSPALSPSDEPSKAAALLRSEGSSLTGLELIVAAELAARDGEARGVPAHAVALEWAGRGGAGTVDRVSELPDAGFAGDPARRRVLAALAAADPVRFGASVEWALHVDSDRAGLPAAVLFPASAGTRGLPPGDAARLLAGHLRSGSAISKEELGGVLDALGDEATRTGRRPCELAAAALAPSLGAASLSAVKAEADALAEALTKMEPRDLVSARRHLRDRELLRGVGLDPASETRILKSWAADAFARTGDVLPCRESVEAALAKSRREPLVERDVDGLRSAAEAIAAMDGGRDGLAVVFEVAASMSGSSASRVELEEASRRLGMETWQGLRSVSGEAVPKEARELVRSVMTIRAVSEATRLLRGDGSGAVEPMISERLRAERVRSVSRKLGADLSPLVPLPEARDRGERGLGR